MFRRSVPILSSSGQSPLLFGLQTADFLHPPCAESRKRKQVGTNPNMKPPLSWPNHLPKTLPSNTILLEDRVSTYGLRLV